MILSILRKEGNYLTHIGSGFVVNTKGLFLTAAHVIKRYRANINQLFVAFPELGNPCILYKIKVHYCEYFDPRSAQGPDEEEMKKLSYHQDLAICRVFSYKLKKHYKIKIKRPKEDELLTIKGFYNSTGSPYPINNGFVDLSSLNIENTKFKIKHCHLCIIGTKDNDYRSKLEFVEDIKKYNNCLTLKYAPHPLTSGGAVLNSEEKVVGIVLGGNKDLYYCNVLCTKYIRKRYRYIDSKKKFHIKYTNNDCT